MRTATLPPGSIEYDPVELINTTMGELGDQLPHGILLPDGSLARRFTLNRPKLAIQKRLGQLRTDGRLRERPGEHACHWLSIALESLEGHDLDKLSRTEAATLLGKLTAGDVIYLLYRWQRLARPEGVSLGECTCGHCGQIMGEVVADLDSMGVVAVPPEHRGGVTARVGLEVGIPLSGQTVRTVVVRAPSWLGSYWRMRRQTWDNSELATSYMLQAAIVGTDVSDADAVPQESVDELEPIDQRLIDRALDKITPTLDLRLTVPCPAGHCGRINEVSLDWRGLDFFGGRSTV